MFESNKYSVWYFSIINKAKTRNWNKRNTSIYLEKHHIIPRSLGGLDNEDNLIYLTAREHYICHLLLPKFTVNQNRSKMIFAFLCISNRRHNTMHRYSGNSKLYESYKKENRILRKEIPGPNTNKFFSEETKYKMSIAKKNRLLSESHKNNMSDSQKLRHSKSGKGYCCLKCNKSFPGSNPSKHFNFCYNPP